MTEQFKDLLLVEIPDWVLNLFSDIGNVGVLEEELIDLQNVFELKPKFKKSSGVLVAESSMNHLSIFMVI